MARNIHVSKITASATPTAWSQAYHAGNLTAVVCVSPKDSDGDETSLHIVGKDLLNTFESEYFTLENKNLISIKQAVETTYKKSATTHNISFLVAAALQNTLYVVLAGNGSILLIRKEKMGTLLEQETEVPAILSSSGFLENGDVVVLAASAFIKLVDKEKLFTALSDTSVIDAAEALTPTVHAASQGDATALFLQYEDETPAVSTVEKSLHETPSQEVTQDNFATPSQIEETPKAEVKKEEPIFSQPLEPTHPPTVKKGLSHKRKLLLTISLIIILVLGATSFFAIRKQQEAKNAALFNASYPQAQKKYDEAQGIMDLNPSLAQQDLTQAQQQLEPLKTQLTNNSTEQKQVIDLLGKIQTDLSTISTANTVAATKVDATTNPLLAYAASHTGTSYLTEDATNIYTADATGITQIAKKTSTSKTLVTNKGTWQSVGGFETYLGNFYLLDTKAGILKFASGNYVKSNYFAAGVSPDLTQVTSIAIDGSIWVLESNGNILKFTKGKQDSLTVSGLDKPFSSPTRIVTTVDDDNVYVLDNGNGRIVELDKTGKFVKSFASTLLKKATQLTVDEKNKTATFLSSGSTYQIPLQ